jgi:hypothetical protein
LRAGCDLERRPQGVLDQIFRILTDDEYRDAMNDWKNESLAQWGAGKAP